MKRRIDPNKARRGIKKIPKLYDGFYTSLVVYIKLILLWICVMGGDFILEFRLEYLYPIYLLLHNSYEAYKFQGVAFTLLLLCIVISVDIICLGVIPPTWLYLLGSLAVWAQVGWTLTPFGPLVILPTLIYIDGKNMRSEPQGLTLAAHCLGFPLVSFGFGLKSYISLKLKQRTRNEVARQNETLYSILWEALPFISPSPINNNELISPTTTTTTSTITLPITPVVQLVKKIPRRKSLEEMEKIQNGAIIINSPTVIIPGQNLPQCSCMNSGNGISNGIQTTPPILQITTNQNQIQQSIQIQPISAQNQRKKKEECCYKLESEVKKLRCELHAVKSIESDLKSNLTSVQCSERCLRTEIAVLQGEHESLLLKYSALVSRTQEERQSYEKKLIEERKLKESALAKQKKAILDCPGDCRRKIRESEREKENLRREIKIYEDKLIRIERELQNVKSTLLHEQKNKESTAETGRLLSLLNALQEQNSHLEQSLSAETRLKLDLFSALGEARRQLALREALIKTKEVQVEEVRGQMMMRSDHFQHNLQPSHFNNNSQAQQQAQAQQQYSSAAESIYERLIES